VCLSDGDSKQGVAEPARREPSSFKLPEEEVKGVVEPEGMHIKVKSAAPSRPLSNDTSRKPSEDEVHLTPERASEILTSHKETWQKLAKLNLNFWHRYFNIEKFDILSQSNFKQADSNFQREMSADFDMNIRK